MVSQVLKEILRKTGRKMGRRSAKWIDKNSATLKQVEGNRGGLCQKTTRPGYQ